MVRKIIVCAPFLPSIMDELRQHFEVVTAPEGGRLRREEVLKALPGAFGLTADGVRVDEEMLKAGRDLKIVVCGGAGYDHVDVEAATKRGVWVCNNPDHVTEPTAEMSVALMLTVCRRVAEWDRLVRRDQYAYWGNAKRMGTTVMDKQLGIIGMGRIGRAVARRARALGMTIAYHNRHRLTSELEEGAKYMDLAKLLRTSDVISLNLPLGASSRRLLGRAEFELMKPTAFVISTARGAVMDETALVEALEQGKIAGAGLDVFEHEPGIPKALLAMDNVVLTPHRGGNADGVEKASMRDRARQLMDADSGKIPANLLNP